MEAEKRKKWSWPTWTAIAIVVVALYPLSDGPANWFVVHFYLDRNRETPQIHDTIYRPLHMLVGKSRTLEAVLAWYEGLFCSKILRYGYWPSSSDPPQTPAPLPPPHEFFEIEPATEPTR